jgi:hypothetical protein
VPEIITAPVTSQIKLLYFTVANRAFEDIERDPRPAHFGPVFIVDVIDYLNDLEMPVARSPHPWHEQTTIRLRKAIEKNADFLPAANADHIPRPK